MNPTTPNAEEILLGPDAQWEHAPPKYVHVLQSDQYPLLYSMQQVAYRAGAIGAAIEQVAVTMRAVDEQRQEMRFFLSVPESQFHKIELAQEDYAARQAESRKPVDAPVISSTTVLQTHAAPLPAYDLLPLHELRVCQLLVKYGEENWRDAVRWDRDHREIGGYALLIEGADAMPQHRLRLAFNHVLHALGMGDCRVTPTNTGLHVFVGKETFEQHLLPLLQVEKPYEALQAQLKPRMARLMSPPIDVLADRQNKILSDLFARGQHDWIHDPRQNVYRYRGQPAFEADDIERDGEPRPRYQAALESLGIQATVEQYQAELGPQATQRLDIMIPAAEFEEKILPQLGEKDPGTLLGNVVRVSFGR